MISSDHSVRLTTHRIIIDSGNIRQQLLLEEYESFELNCNPVGHYGVLLTISVFLLSRRYYIKITGIYNSVRFGVASFRKRSIRKKLQKQEEQSAIAKKHTVKQGGN